MADIHIKTMISDLSEKPVSVAVSLLMVNPRYLRYDEITIWG